MKEEENNIEELRCQDNDKFASLRGERCLADFEKQRVAISFTGGKDCHLAMQRCIENGLEVVALAVFYPPGTAKFQAHRIEWQQIQANAMDIPLVMCCLTELNTNPTDYKYAYACAIAKLQSKYEISALVTGDIDFVGSTSTTNFMQDVCTNYPCNNVKLLLPLWQQNRKDLLYEMVNEDKERSISFDIRLCCVKTPYFDESWIGKQLNLDVIHQFEKTKPIEGSKPLDLTGENGEYHTMVVNGSMYKHSLEFINLTTKELKEQRGQKSDEKWWVVDENTTELVKKE